MMCPDIAANLCVSRDSNSLSKNHHAVSPSPKSALAISEVKDTKMYKSCLNVKLVSHGKDCSSSQSLLNEIYKARMDCMDVSLEIKKKKSLPIVVCERSWLVEESRAHQRTCTPACRWYRGLKNQDGREPKWRLESSRNQGNDSNAIGSAWHFVSFRFICFFSF